MKDGLNKEALKKYYHKTLEKFKQYYNDPEQHTRYSQNWDLPM